MVGGDAELGRDRAEQRLGRLQARAGLLALRGDAPGRSRPARRRRASRARTSSAAASRPDTICPGRNAGSRRARSVAQAPDQLVGERRAWSGRRRRCSTRPLRNRRSRRRSARRPWSGARRRPSSSASTSSPSASSACQLSSENGLVMRGCSAMRVDPHVEVELDIGEARQARDRRGVAIMRRRGERDVAFAGQQARGRIEADPAGAGQIDLAQACRSVKSWSVPGGPSSATSGLSWIR